MIHKTTHTYTISASGPLKLDIYHPPSELKPIDKKKTPAMVYFHGGGLVAMNRELVPVHVVQSCIKRGWPLISPDYDLLPQVKGESLVENIREANEFVRKKLFSIVNGKGEGERQDKGEVWENIVVAGASAGGYLTFQSGHYLVPKPLALLVYYGPGNTLTPFYNNNTILGPAPIPLSKISHFLSGPVTSGATPKSVAFYPESLLENGEKDDKYEGPVSEVVDWANHRAMLYPYFIQENKFQEFLGGVDVDFSDGKWRRGYPETVVVHGNKDNSVPFGEGKAVVDAIGEKAKIFPVEGAEHGFDAMLFLGDPKLEVVERAWGALDEIVKRRTGRS